MAYCIELRRNSYMYESLEKHPKVNYQFLETNETWGLDYSAISIMYCDILTNSHHNNSAISELATFSKWVSLTHTDNFLNFIEACGIKSLGRLKYGKRIAANSVVPCAFDFRLFYLVKSMAQYVCAQAVKSMAPQNSSPYSASDLESVTAALDMLVDCAVESLNLYSLYSNIMPRCSDTTNSYIVHVANSHH